MSVTEARHPPCEKCGARPMGEWKGTTLCGDCWKVTTADEGVRDHDYERIPAFRGQVERSREASERRMEALERSRQRAR